MSVTEAVMSCARESVMEAPIGVRPTRLSANKKMPTTRALIP